MKNMPKFKITERTVNFLLIFILGFLVGVALKSEAQKRVTIGFNDYLVPKYKQDINLMAPALTPVAPQGQEQVPGPADGQNVAPQDQQSPQNPQTAPAPENVPNQPQ
jgi:hypothetical protein